MSKWVIAGNSSDEREYVYSTGRDVNLQADKIQILNLTWKNYGVMMFLFHGKWEKLRYHNVQ